MVKLPEPGKIWHRFERQCVRNGTCKRFLVQEIVEYMHEDVMRFLERYYFTGFDPFAKAAYEKEPGSAKKYSAYWKNDVLPQNLSIVCLERIANQPIEKAKIVGAHLFQKCKTDKTTKENQNPLPDMITKINEIVESKYDLYKTYHMEQYLKTVGMCVRSDYVNLNIAEGMMLASEEICKANDLKLTTVESTSLTFQTSAERTGFRSLVLTEMDEIENAVNYKFSENLKEIRVMAKFVS